jgi:hypothetical protein
MSKPDLENTIRDRIIFIFRTGTNEMSFRRVHCINALKEQTECNICLVTVDNLHEYILDEYPLHPAYPYLSETHKCDYLEPLFYASLWWRLFGY